MMKLVDKVTLDGMGTVLIESSRSINFDLLTYLISAGWDISESQIEEVEIEGTSTRKAVQFLRLLKQQKGGNTSDLIKAFEFQIGRKSLLVDYLTNAPQKTAIELQDEKYFLRCVDKYNFFVFDPYIQSRKKADLLFVAMETSSLSESFVKEKGQILELVNSSDKTELGELIKLTEDEKNTLSARLETRLSANKLLQLHDVIESDWKKIAVDVGMESCVHAIQTNFSNSDMCLEFLNKLFQRCYQKMTVSFIFYLLKKFYKHDFKLLKTVMESLDLVLFWNKLNDVMIVVDTQNAP